MKFYTSFWLLLVLAIGAMREMDILPLIFAVALHEGGHIAALKSMGGKIGEIKANLSGVAIKTINKGISTVKDEIFLNVAGPLFGIIGALIAWHLYLTDFAKMSLFISLFNLLPLEGLDGGTIAKEILEDRFGENGRRAAMIISRLIMITVVIFIVLSIAVFLK